VPTRIINCQPGHKIGILSILVYRCIFKCISFTVILAPICAKVYVLWAGSGCRHLFARHSVEDPSPGYHHSSCIWPPICAEVYVHRAGSGCRHSFGK